MIKFWLAKTAADLIVAIAVYVAVILFLKVLQ